MFNYVIMLYNLTFFNIVIMAVTYEIPNVPVGKVGIFASHKPNTSTKKLTTKVTDEAKK